MTEIVQGGLYRRKSDGAKLLALKPRVDAIEGWRFWNEGSDYFDYAKLSQLEPWREPLRKKVTGYVWLFNSGNYNVCGSKPGAADPNIIACKKFEVEIEEGSFDGG